MLMMNSLFRKHWYLAVVAVLFFASVSFAGTTSVTITSVGDGANLAGVYVDPYNATVGTATNVPVICDDWSDNVTVGESWTANVINLSTAGTSSVNPLFGNTLSSTAQQGLYNELAWLGTQLLANPKDPATQDVVSFAIWELTNPYYPGTPEALPSASALGTITWNGVANTSVQAAVNSELLLAGAQTGFNGSGWEILTPASWPTNVGQPQEFLVYTPESSAVILFGADMLGLAALAFFFRRRLVQTEI